MVKFERDIYKLCLKYNATYKHGRRGGHYKIMCSDKIIRASCTPSDPYALANIESDLRKACKAVVIK
jgi:hypothetical protein